MSISDAGKLPGACQKRLCSGTSLVEPATYHSMRCVGAIRYTCLGVEMQDGSVDAVSLSLSVLSSFSVCGRAALQEFKLSCALEEGFVTNG